ncbi:sialate O-acetylesterase [Opitutus sp. GAS368]|uniref:sialate O-acetylesterase n=1 Tax=Opitutus sp. GAS368 TaxID=1882749 RepID=UPI000B87CBA0|nr:sialate O-acetylesterase [Opitutus sp. GAS368]
MLRSLSRLAWFCLGFAGLGVLRADVTLAPLFQDHAVLQCDQPVPVWGWADPGEVVLVSFRGQHQRVTTSADGRWLARLAPLAASTGSAELVITGKNTVRVADVLVGEVWLCSGQSNMEFPVYDPTSRIFHLDQARTEVAAANFPLIRQYKVARAVAEKPADTGRGNWAVCSPETVGTFTAVGYFFARDLHRTLGVPIGIINSSWGGTPVESWMSAEALASDPAFHVVDERWQQMLADYPAKKIIAGEALAAWRQAEAAAKAAGAGAHAAFLKQNHPPRMPRGPGDSWTPRGLFNGMIAPLVPAAFRGVLWYQGESNAGRAAEYRALFGALIRQWRRTWGRDDFPFYFVQLANYRVPSDATGETYAFLREAQSQTLMLPGTGMAVIIDIGNPGDIHPGNKQEVGRRLALIAAAKTYGHGGESSGPVYASSAREGAVLRVKFSHATGLAAHTEPLAGFAVAGANRIFHPANACIEGDTVIVSSPDVPEPVAVRYAWANSPAAGLFNFAGLPATPFRTDNW